MDHIASPDGSEPGNGSDPSSAAYGSVFFIAGSTEEAAQLATLREKFGDEFADRLERARPGVNIPGR